VQFHDQLFAESGDRVALQADRVPSFIMPSRQPTSTTFGDRTVSSVMDILTYLFIIYKI